MYRRRDNGIKLHFSAFVNFFSIVYQKINEMQFGFAFFMASSLIKVKVEINFA